MWLMIFLFAVVVSMGKTSFQGKVFFMTREEELSVICHLLVKLLIVLLTLHFY